MSLTLFESVILLNALRKVNSFTLLLCIRYFTAIFSAAESEGFLIYISLRSHGRHIRVVRAVFESFQPVEADCRFRSGIGEIAF